MFNNLTAVPVSDSDSSLNHTENLLQELMDTTDLSHINLPGAIDETLKSKKTFPTCTIFAEQNTNIWA